MTPEIRPEIREVIPQDEDSVLLHLFIPATLPLFAGHFPGAPILPGVLQIHWAAHLGQEHLPLPGAFQRLVNIKFQQVIRPDSEVSLRLRRERMRGQLQFDYTSANGPHASGRLEFLHAAP